MSYQADTTPMPPPKGELREGIERFDGEKERFAGGGEVCGGRRMRFCSWFWAWEEREHSVGYRLRDLRKLSWLGSI